jgi:hypothetical protein
MENVFRKSYSYHLCFDLGKPIHRRDAEAVEKTQRENMKRVMRKERTKRRNAEERRKHPIPFFFSQRFLCGLCVSAVNRLC